MRLRDLMPRVATLPLGSGALAGNPFLVDRQYIAKELGFIGGVCPNSMDAVSDRKSRVGWGGVGAGELGTWHLKFVSFSCKRGAKKEEKVVRLCGSCPGFTEALVGNLHHLGLIGGVCPNSMDAVSDCKSRGVYGVGARRRGSDRVGGMAGGLGRWEMTPHIV